MEKLLVLLAIAGLGILSTSAQNCNECQTDNDVYCVNQTHFYNCMGGDIKGTIQNCNQGYICSNTDVVCVEESTVDGTTIKDVCGSSGGNGAHCSTCDGTSKYTCVTSTQYSRCSGTTLLTNTFDCDTNEVCVLSALADFQTICVPNCTLSYLQLTPTCSNTVEVPTTTLAPTTLADYTNVCQVAAGSTSNTLYFYTKNTEDSTCHSYIYCQRSKTTDPFDKAIYLKCASATPYYNSTTNKCVSTKPSNC